MRSIRWTIVIDFIIQFGELWRIYLHFNDRINSWKRKIALFFLLWCSHGIACFIQPQNWTQREIYWTLTWRNEQNISFRDHLDVLLSIFFFLFLSLNSLFLFWFSLCGGFVFTRFNFYFFFLRHQWSIVICSWTLSKIKARITR